MRFSNLSIALKEEGPETTNFINLLYVAMESWKMVCGGMELCPSAKLT